MIIGPGLGVLILVGGWGYPTPSLASGNEGSSSSG